MVTHREVPDWLRAAYPFEPRHFSTPGGATMSYVDEGPRCDEAVLMLHGNPTWSFFYRRLIQELAPTMRCVAPDHVGMGLSDQPEDYDYTLAGRVRDVEALVIHLGLKKVHLVVHDWGGAIGMGWTADHAAQLDRVVVMNTAAFPLNRIPARIALCKLPVIGPLLVRGANGFAAPATSMAMHRRSLTPMEKRAYLLPYSSWASRVAVNAFVRDIPMKPAHRSWAALQRAEAGVAALADKQVLLAWGMRDFCFDPHFLAEWQHRLPTAQVERYNDAGHYLLEDAPEAVERAAAFLKSRAA